MSIEELLDKLENDRVEAEGVRHECYEKIREAQMEVKDAFDCALDVDEFYKHLDDLSLRVRDAEDAERIACYEINRITTTINEIKKELARFNHLVFSFTFFERRNDHG